MAKTTRKRNKAVEKWLENVQKDQDFLPGLKSLAKLKVADVVSIARKLAGGDTLGKEERHFLCNT